jgi:hypothetical protein
MAYPAFPNHTVSRHWPHPWIVSLSFFQTIHPRLSSAIKRFRPRESRGRKSAVSIGYFDQYSARVFPHCADSPIAKAQGTPPVYFQPGQKYKYLKRSLGMPAAILSVPLMKSIRNSHNLRKDLVVHNCTFESVKWLSITCSAVTLSR